MSSLTATNDASTPVESRTQRRDNSGLSDEDEPLPKKALPDFNPWKSEEDSIASGKDLDGLDQEDGRVMNELTAQAEEDDARDNAIFPDAHMRYGASLGGSLCDSHNPTLRLINRRFSRQYRNVLRHNTKKHKNKIGRELKYLIRRSKNLSAGTLASLVKLYLSVLPLLHA